MLSDEDLTGNNSGNWTAAWTPDEQNIHMAQYEVRKIKITGGSPNIKFQVYIETNIFTGAILNPYGENEWEPSTDGEFLLRGETFYFYFRTSVADGLPPLVTMWFKFDDQIRANQYVERT